MGTKKEQTLQIKDFRGVNRFNDGTITQPNEFYTLQNWHPINRAEIASISGVVDQTPASMPGVGSILHTAFLEQGFGERFYLAFFNFNSTVATPTLSSSNFTTSGGTTTTHVVKIQYIGPGGAFSETTLAGTTIQANGLTYTIPVDVPAYVFQINVYINASNTISDDPYVLCGSMHRRSGVFAASITVPKPVFAVTTSVVPDVQPTDFLATGTTGGSLVANRTYYIAIAPFMGAFSAYQVNGGRDTRAYLTTTTSVTSFMTFQTGAADTAVKLTFNFAASPAVAAGTNVTRWCVFIGTTPEDMMAVSDTTNGTVVPITDTVIRNGTFTVKEIPYNSNLGIWMNGTGNRSIGGNRQGVDTVVAIEDPSSSVNRNFGHYRALNYYGAIGTGAGPDISEGTDYGPGTGTLNSNPTSGVTGIWVTKTLPWAETTSYQIAYNINEKSRSINGGYFKDISVAFATAYNPSFFWNFSDTEIHTVAQGDRLYCANGQNHVSYTNGYVFRHIMKDNGGSPIPITKYVENVKDRLVCAGGPDNFANTTHQVFFSEVNDTFNFGAAPVWNNFRVWSKDEINGLAVYSQNIDVSGPSSFLTISKKDNLFSWNGLSGSSQVVSELNFKVGFAGPRAFARTKLGPVFVGSDNIYVFKSSDQILPFGYEFKDVINGLTGTQKNLVNCVYHDDKFKIAYPSSGTDLDREIWLELRLEDGAIQKYYSGPHTLLAFNSQAVANTFGSSSNVRLSTLSGQVYQRDSGTLNNGASIARKIIINRLGLQQDHFIKVMTRIYMSLKIAQDETFTFTLDQEGGTSQTTKTVSALIATAARQFLQAHVVDRVLGRVNSLTIDNTSDEALSIYDISMLYNILRRRQLR